MIEKNTTEDNTGNVLKKRKKIYICTNCNRTFVKERMRCIDCESPVAVSVIDCEDLDEFASIENDKENNNIDENKNVDESQSIGYYCVFVVFIFFTFGSVANIGRAYWLTPVFYACASLLVFPPLYPYFKKFDFFKNISVRKLALVMFLCGFFASGYNAYIKQQKINDIKAKEDAELASKAIKKFETMTPEMHLDVARRLGDSPLADKHLAAVPDIFAEKQIIVASLTKERASKAALIKERASEAAAAAQMQQKLDEIAASEQEFLRKSKATKRSLCGILGDDDAPSGLISLFKESMNDPDSFELVKTRCVATSSGVVVLVEFRGKNAFAAKMLGSFEGHYTPDGEFERMYSNGE